VSPAPIFPKRLHSDSYIWQHWFDLYDAGLFHTIDRKHSIISKTEDGSHRFKTGVRRSFARTVVTIAIAKRHQMISASLGHSRGSASIEPMQALRAE
jgi:hypothetical protein